MKYYVRKKISLEEFKDYKEKARKESLWFKQKNKKKLKRDLLKAKRKWKWVEKHSKNVKKKIDRKLALLEKLDPNMPLEFLFNINPK
ncbi:hypothetical protein [Aggregatibacter actinomycetemcomitans]|uniref:hypothetical protein n=1 Tax=Aggregatibacter actinomycetemcomitans TaxID=714 RepID=UPI00023FFCD2|nr:hypothetical protein [Aggregatibacter actinomycetemcomitans]EHK89552.1 hypothetical protein RHAA1_09441 [Aggregatibacter actinomycetemcomitans RhAA1]KNE76657.1 hypothetical protein RHAA2_09685 [Aggregatibacter actinomycetemcomitans RhAA1]MBN6078917.1 hypothetical protein [Aggregatibacter actinomycetemcomitans]MBN6081611.1 hypothetical protein [Aggregatibacter actinomycetemcomitans]